MPTHHRRSASWVGMLFFSLLLISPLSVLAAAPKESPMIRGSVVDSETGQPVPARVTIRDVSTGEWLFADPATSEGRTVHYKKERGGSVEMHTSVSAAPFVVTASPGVYRFTLEQGPESVPLVQEVSVQGQDVEVTFPLKRWIRMSESGWYSGDTHVHRTLEELKTVQPAEDLNVSFPLTYWSWDAYQPPTKQDPGFPEGESPQVIPIDSTHVILPMNTEFEIDRVNGKKHSLGAFFVLNHKTPFTTGVPPVKPILEKVRSEGALLELDKHNWPWSMMLVPTLGIDLYELSNNHIWQTDFLFKDFGEPAPDFMEIERDSQGQWTEKGWIQFGFQNYYLLLNCGFHLSPTAGTASGVHPVPLGYGRVYVHLKEGFRVEGWIEGLRAGRSFVTTGPMLEVEAEGFPPGHKFKHQGSPDKPIRLSGRATSVTPMTAIELVANGRVVQKQVPQNAATPHGGYLHPIDLEWVPEGSGWFAIRCYEEREPGRIRFAHSAPYWVEIEGKPLLPDSREVEFLKGRMKEQIERNKGVLTSESVAEYRRALERFSALPDTD